MSWYEVSVHCKAEQAESVILHMENLGALAVSIFDAEDQSILEPMPGELPIWDEAKIVGLYPKTIAIEQLQKQLSSQTNAPSIHVSILQDQAWERSWMEHFQPMQFANHLWIVPSNAENFNQTGPRVILDPGLAFGTGTHPTTSLCLEYLAKFPPINQTVLDFGCGSGILGIAALKLGARYMYGIDHDQQAIASSIENLKRNAIKADQYQICLPEAVDSNLVVDCVVANILAKPLIDLADKIQSFCAPQGKLLLSGLLDNQAEEVMQAYRPWFEFEPLQQQDEWILLIGSKKKG